MGFHDPFDHFGGRLGRAVEDGAYGSVELVKSARADYDSKGRYQKIRVWILFVFALDVLFTVAFVASSDPGSERFEAWFQPGFPSNMVVIRNLGERSADDVLLILDGRFRSKVATLVPGPTGLQIDTEFRDGVGGSPPDSYLPRRLEIRFGDTVAEVRVVPNRESL